MPCGFCWTEAANALWVIQRCGTIEKDGAADALTRPRTAPLMFPASDGDLVSRALRLAELLDHPAYDCVYLALSIARRLPVVTAERRLDHPDLIVLSGSFAVLARAEDGNRHIHVLLNGGEFVEGEPLRGRFSEPDGGGRRSHAILSELPVELACDLLDAGILEHGPSHAIRALAAGGSQVI